MTLHKLQRKCTILTCSPIFQKLLFSIVVFLIAHSLVNIFLISSYDSVEIDIISNTQDSYQIYYTGGKYNYSFREFYSMQGEELPRSESKTITFPVKSKTIRTLRIDPGNQPGVYRISKISLNNRYTRKLISLSPNTPGLMVKHDPQSTLTTDNLSWILSAKGNDPYIIFTGSFGEKNNFYSLFFPSLFAFVASIFIPTIKSFRFSATAIIQRIKKCKFWTDATLRQPSSGERYESLDGLRGLAALLVIADHAGISQFHGLGPVGVLLFFFLSGFLLSIPFANTSARITNPSYLKNYFLRRLKRILPMYYFSICILYLPFGDLVSFFRASLFIEGLGILWTVIQEVYFYLALPLLILINHYIFRNVHLLCGLFLLILAYMFNNKTLYPILPLLYQIKYISMIGMFMCGMSVCYLHKTDFIKNNRFIKAISNSNIIGIGLIVSLFLTHYIKRYTMGLDYINPGWIYKGNYFLFIGIFLFFVIMSKKSLLYKALTFYPMRVIGVLGYSLYILHAMILYSVRYTIGNYVNTTLSATTIFALTLIITLILSSLTYTFIERPFLINETSWLSEIKQKLSKTITKKV